jgi:phospholipid/cholesterol/gamma-HCH transport system permease protein
MTVAGSLAAADRDVAEADGPHFAVARDGDALVLRLAGDWLLARAGPDAGRARQELRAAAQGAATLRFDADALGRWDTVLPSFLVGVVREARAAGLAVELGGLPYGAVRLVRLATAVPERGVGGPVEARRGGVAERVGRATLEFARGAADLTAFVGETSLALVQLARGRARTRGRDFWLAVQQVGADALPIVTLISVLVGMILAFIGGAQLAIFGAQVYVANLVAIGMAREMGAMMAAVIMAGRTGAAFAAELGTMQVNEEIDALRTLGISPIEFLVLPRLLALALMMPLLAVYADLFGMLGGAVVGVGLFDLSPAQYWQQSLRFIGLKDFAGGLFKAVVFGVLVGAAGCLRGIRSGRDAAAVGASTTAAVVSGIVAVIVADCLLNVVYHALGV